MFACVSNMGNREIVSSKIIQEKGKKIASIKDRQKTDKPKED